MSIFGGGDDEAGIMGADEFLEFCRQDGAFECRLNECMTCDWDKDILEGGWP